jgi:uncharacterized protein (TIGR03083 family)
MAFRLWLAAWSFVMFSPIDVVDLFPEERAALLAVLQELSADEWQLPTVCEGWSVADVALHILWTDVSYLSRHRDNYFGPPGGPELDLSDWETLVAFINGLNDDWIRGTRRMSPQLTMTFLRATGTEMAAFQLSRDLFATGMPVSWAGSGPAPVWLDVAREYTERWVHQQHIRDAVGRPGLTERRYFHPVLDAFARALPHALRDQTATDGTRVQLVIDGDAGGTWTTLREGDGWVLDDVLEAPAAATVTMDQDLAWRLFTKGVDQETVAERAVVTGDRGLAEPVLRMVSIIA